MSGSSRRAARSAAAKSTRISIDLALVDQAFLVGVDELDRILDGEDVLVALGVDPVDHRRQRRALAAACRPGHEHESARAVNERRDRRWKPEIVEAPNLLRDHPIHGRYRGALAEHVAAESRQTFDPERQVQIERLFVPLPLRAGEDAVSESLRVGRSQDREVKCAKPAMHPCLWRRARSQVEIRPVQIDDRLQQLV